NGIDDDRQHRAEQDAEQDRPLDVPGHEDAHDHERHYEHYRGPRGDLSVDPQLHGDRRTRRVRDPAYEPGVDQAHQRDEQADADGDTALERLRYRVEHHRAHAGDHQQQHHDAVDQYEPHHRGPRHHRGQGHRDERVEPQAGRDREREVRDHPHEDGHHTRDQGGDGRDLVDGQDRPRHVLGRTGVIRRVATEDERIEHDDVGHGHERDHAPAHFSADGGTSLADPEEPIDRRPLLPRGHI